LKILLAAAPTSKAKTESVNILADLLPEEMPYVFFGHKHKLYQHNNQCCVFLYNSNIMYRFLYTVALCISEIHQTQPKLLPKNLTFQPLSEAFIRRSWYSVFPVLDTTGRRRVKKAVICVAQLVAALITVHGLLSFLSDV